jgi:DNA-directed RNA polymerase subunit RPC12/RpoP
MKPPFGISWNNKRYCDKPECQHAKELTRQRSVKESQARHKAKSTYLSRSDGLSKAQDRKWACRDCGKMSDNRLHCPECRARRLAKEDTRLSEYPIGTIDISNMGVLT